MIDNLICLLLVSLAGSFLASLVTKQNGPLFIFSAFRMNVGTWAARKIQANGIRINNGDLSEKRKDWLLRYAKLIKSISELVVCPYCLGPWIVLLGVAIFANDNLLLNWFAGSGLLYIWLGIGNGRT